MRSTLALAGLAVGVATALAPLAPASAQCDPQILAEGSGCSNGCQDFSQKYDEVAQKTHLPTGIWQCTE
jgi:hypothetical protein